MNARFCLELASRLYTVSASGGDVSAGVSVAPGAADPASFSPRAVVRLSASSLSIPSCADQAGLDALLSDAAFWRSLDAEGARELAGLARRIALELQGDEPSSASLASAYALEFLILASRRAAAWKAPSGVWRIEDAKRYIEDNYEQAFSLEFFTDKCAMNTSDFSRRFKELAGCPLFEFINRQRVRRACALLKSSGLSIIEISEAVGYNNLSFFNRYFLRIVGLSPRQYRSSVTG
jgi:AraC-like DNA-binding protein